MSCECDVTIASLTATLKMKNDQCEALILERDRYKAALEKMLIPGSGLMCTCGVCYICIAAEALRLSEKERSDAQNDMPG